MPCFDEKGRLKNTPCVAITANVKQLPFFNFLKEKLGGWIRYKKKENAIVWTITARREILNLFTLMNGYLRSPKLYQFNLLIDYLNKIFPSAQLVKHDTDCSLFFENSWLAGFIDADGGFKIRYTKRSVHRQTGRKTKERIALSFKIEQRQYHKNTNESFEPLMKSIADFFTVPLHITKHNNTEYWCVEIRSFSRMQNLIDYLSVHPL